MGLFSRTDWGSTRIDDTVGDWTRSVSDWDPGVLEATLFTQPAAWLGGEFEVAPPLSGGRRFSFTVDSVRTTTPTSTAGTEFDEIDALNLLFDIDDADEVELKTQRVDRSGATVSRSIWVRCVNAYPYQIGDDKSASGVIPKRSSGRIRYRVECYARFGYWRDTSANSSTTLVATSSGVTAAIANAGKACGCKVEITAKTGSPTLLVLTNDRNSYVATFTSVAVGKSVDANHTNPTGVILPASGVQYDSYIRLEKGTNTFTGTTTGGTNATLAFTYRRLWGSP